MKSLEFFKFFSSLRSKIFGVLKPTDKKNTAYLFLLVKKSISLAQNSASLNVHSHMARGSCGFNRRGSISFTCVSCDSINI